MKRIQSYNLRVTRREMPLMKIMGFLYAAVFVLLLIEFLIQIIYVCLYLNQPWLIFPYSISMILFLGWGSYQLLCEVRA